MAYTSTYTHRRGVNYDFRPYSVIKKKINKKKIKKKLSKKIIKKKTENIYGNLKNCAHALFIK